MTHLLLGDTDFSGGDMALDAMTTTVNISAKAQEELAPTVWFVKSCDIGSFQQKILLGRSRLDACAPCVFTSMAQVLQEDAGALMVSMEPDPAASADVARKAYSGMADYLMQNNTWAIPESQFSFCLAHKGLCPLHPGFVVIEDSGKLRSMAAQQDELSDDDDSPMSDTMPEVSDLQAKAWWRSDLCEKFPVLEDTTSEMRTDPRHRPLLVNIAGLECIDHSPLGEQRRDAGPSARQHAVFLGTRASLAKAHVEDLGFSESSSFYPTLARQKPLEPQIKVLAIKTGSEQLSFPTRRYRSLGANVNQETLVWLGPEADNIQEDFDHMFNRRLMLDASVYFNATPDEVFQAAQQMAASRKKVLPEHLRDVPMADYMDRICPPCNLDIKAQYEDWFIKKEIPRPHYADLDHHPGRGLRPGSSCPSLDTHPKVYGFAEQRFLTPLELLGTMGIDIGGPLSGGRPVSSLAKLFDQLSRHDQLVLVGNGMHVPTMAAWFLYVCAHCRRRSDFFQLPLHVGLPDEALEDDGEV
jgi:hypothetical protein